MFPKSISMIETYKAKINDMLKIEQDFPTSNALSQQCRKQTLGVDRLSIHGHVDPHLVKHEQVNSALTLVNRILYAHAAVHVSVHVWGLTPVHARIATRSLRKSQKSGQGLVRLSCYCWLLRHRAAVARAVVLAVEDWNIHATNSSFCAVVWNLEYLHSYTTLLQMYSHALISEKPIVIYNICIILLGKPNNVHAEY